MAKKGRIERNERVKRTVERHRVRREALRERQRVLIFEYNKKLSEAKTPEAQAEIKRGANLELYGIMRIFQRLPRDGSSTRIRNRCSVTGKPRGFHGICGVSRNVIREAISFGLLMGFRKSSW